MSMQKVMTGSGAIDFVAGKENPVFVYPTYKDRIFRRLFSERKRLLELYNALNNTNYTNENELTVNTLENAIFMKMKNDVSFVIDCNMCLYEHQSTYCPNMPLRGLFYFTDLYKKLVKDIDLSSGRHIKIPAPHYIVFYNGTERKEEEFTQKLSEAYENGNDGCIELTVKTVNVNQGHNRDLLAKCKTLSDYAYFVDAVRKRVSNMATEIAVEEAIDECIQKDILKEFLLEQKAEVIAMSIYEYNEEYVKRVLYEDGYEEGKNVGKAEGKAEAIIDLLSEIGNIPEDIIEKVKNQKDLTVLRRWLKLAAKVLDISEFIKEM